MENKQPNYLLYDGECPFCASFSKYYALKQAIPNLEIVSVRDTERLRSLALPSELDFNQGMILILSDGRIAQGDAALSLLGTFLEPRTLWDRLVILLGRVPALSRLVYPIVFRLRLWLLKLKGIGTDLPRTDLTRQEPSAPLPVSH